MNEWDCVLAGFGGGVVGAFIVLTTMHFHWRSLISQYRNAKGDFRISLSIKDMQDDIEELQEQVKAANEAFNKR